MKKRAPSSRLNGARMVTRVTVDASLLCPTGTREDSKPREWTAFFLEDDAKGGGKVRNKT